MSALRRASARLIPSQLGRLVTTGPLELVASRRGFFARRFQHARHLSAGADSDPSAPSTTPVKKKVGKVREMWNKYGMVAIGTYGGVYVGTLGLMYIGVSLGFAKNIDVPMLLEKLPFMHGRKVDPAAGNFAVAWILTKFTEPVRAIVTVAVTPRVARMLGRVPAEPDVGAEDAKAELPSQPMHPQAQAWARAQTQAQTQAQGATNLDRVEVRAADLAQHASFPLFGMHPFASATGGASVQAHDRHAISSSSGSPSAATVSALAEDLVKQATKQPHNG